MSLGKPGDDLTADEVAAIHNFPEKLGKRANGPEVTESLIRNGYAKPMLSGGLSLTEKGQQAKRDHRPPTLGG